MQTEERVKKRLQDWQAAPRGIVVGKPTHQPQREAGYRTQTRLGVKVRPEFLAVPGSRPGTADFATTMAYMSVFAGYSEYAVVPPDGPRDESFAVLVEYGDRVALVRYTSRVPRPDHYSDARHAPAPGSFWQSVSQMLKAFLPAAAGLGVAASLIPVVLADPIMPLCRARPELIHNALDNGLREPHRNPAHMWANAHADLIYMATEHALAPSLSDDPNWMAFWQRAAGSLAELVLRIPGSLLSKGERQFLHYHYSAMFAWPGLYNLPGGAK